MLELNLCKYTLSANEIRQFCECARKRYYSSRDCLALRTRKPSNALLLGSAFHAALQYYYTELNKLVEQDPRGVDNLTISDTLGLLDTIPNFQLYTDVTDPETGVVSREPIVKEEDLKTLENMIECYKPQIAEDILVYEVVECESSFNMTNWPINDVQYHGLVDMIVRERATGKVFFFEHKTCAGFRPEIYSRFDIQLHIYYQYGVNMHGPEFGGMILNQVKKAKTIKGYDQLRNVYTWDNVEIRAFEIWLKAKTQALVEPSNNHAPCNNYMTCKMCEYVSLCMQYGYGYPKTTQEVLDNKDFEGEYLYDPRISNEEEV